MGSRDSRIPDAPTVPVDSQSDDITDGTIVNPLDRFQVGSLVMTLQADTDLELLLLGNLVRFQNLTDAWGIDSDWLLHEDVLSGLHCVFEVNRAEARWRCEQHQINAAVDHFLIGVKAREDLFGRNLNAICFVFQATLDAIQDITGCIFEGIADSGQLDIPVCRQGLSGSAGSATAASNQTNLDCVVAAGVDRTVQAKVRNCGSTKCRDTGCLQKIATAGFCGMIH